MKNPSAKGFTLIELMIVVAIIAIISAIAIPSLMKARLSSNEGAAIASLRTLVAVQHSYHKNYGEFGDTITTLSTTDYLPDTQLADAESTAAATGAAAKGGYWYFSNTNYSGEEYFHGAVPVGYNATGRYSYFVSNIGTVYMTEMADTPLNVIGEYDDANDWDANVDSWDAAK